MLKKIILLICFLLGFISFSQKNYLVKVDSETFFNSFISQKKYSIDLLLKELENNQYYKSKLINKGIRFKVFFDSQEIAVDNYSNKCYNYDRDIRLTNFLIKNKFKTGLDNSKFIFNYSIQNIPNFKTTFENKIDNLDELKKTLLNQKCETFLKYLQLRKLGVFDKMNQQNLLSFNYITNPVDEILNGFSFEFSTISTASNVDFILTLTLPKSWNIRKKNTFSFDKTIGLFEPFEKFLSSIISITFHKRIFTKNEMETDGITDRQLIEEIYNDDETLEMFIRKSNTDIKTFITLFDDGKNKFIGLKFS